MLSRTVEFKFALLYFAGAILLLLLFAAGHLVGLRGNVSILADPMGGGGDSLFAGIYYVLTWVGVTLVAPILAGAALLSFSVGLLRSR